MQSFPLPLPSPGYRVSGKEVEVRDSGSQHHQLCGCCNLQLIQSHAAPSHGPPARVLSPLSFLAKSLLLPKPHGKKKHPKTSWSSLLSFRTVWSFSPFQNRVILFLSPQNLVVLPVYFRTTWPSSFSLRTSWFLLYFRAAWSPIYFRAAWSLLTLWLPGLGLNPSTQLPLQPHFRLLLQSATPASIPVFFQLYWAAIVSLGRCGPMAWSQSSPRSHAGPVTRGSYFPVPSWVEVTPISLAQSRATAI